MANYLTTDTDLTAVADAIRTKGGTSADLVFPQGFVDAISAISGGGGGEWTTDGIAGGTEPSGAITISLPTDNTWNGGIQGYSFFGRKRITSITIENNPQIQSNAFQNCGVVTFSAPNLTHFGAKGVGAKNNILAGCSSLKNVYIPKVTSGGTNTFDGCSSLEEIVLPSYTAIGQSTFRGCSKLVTLVLGRTSAICTLANINAFASSPFASGGTGGTLYVPQDLIATYQSATNWSTILGYANNQILPIEGSEYE